MNDPDQDPAGQAAEEYQRRPLAGRGDATGPRRRGTVSVLSVGCKANREEMECLLSRLADAGWRVAAPGEPADLVVVNTCTVTAEGDADSRRAIRRAGRAGAQRVVVTGCLAQRDPQGVAALPAVTWVVGNAEKPHLAPWILEGPDVMAGDRSAEVGIDDVRAEDRVPGPSAPVIRVSADPTVSGFAAYGDGQAGRRSRATLKVQDGCDARCTYCIIPKVRGRSRSRGLEDCLRQARRLAASGYREIALTGINTAAWGDDLPGRPNLGDLVDALTEIEGIARIRLNSLEPDRLTPALLGRLTNCRRLCHHIHLPMQSGDPATLRRMGRPYDPETYVSVVEQIRARWPDVAIGCDVLAGFPGEDDAAFASTVRCLERIEPAYVHAFSYSARPGTPALRLGGALSREETRARTARLRALGAVQQERFQQAQLGSIHELLPERASGGGEWTGTTGNYLKVRFPWTGSGAGRRELLRVRLLARRADGVMTGELVARSVVGR